MIFILVLHLILFLLDAYVLFNWKKFVKAKNWSRYYYIIPFIVAGLMVPTALLINFYRFQTPTFSGFLIAVYSAVNFWYLPKIAIAIVLIINDIIRYSIKFTLFIKRKLKPAQQPIPEAEDQAVSKRRRHILQTAGWGFATVPFVLIGHGIVSTTRNVQVYPVDIPIVDLPDSFDGFTIMQISDIHAGSFSNDHITAEARALIAAHKPDIVFVTGDFVNFDSRELKIIHNQLQLLDSKNGVLGCLGNHDHYMDERNHKYLVDMIADTNVKLLDNENTIIRLGNDSLQIAGVDNIGMRQSYGDLDAAFDGLDPSKPTILLCHDPTNWDKNIINQRKVDLMLSGHTHGGQIGIELFGKELSPAHIVFKQWAGLYKSKDQYLYVNRGLGTTGPPFRVGIQPEVSLITLKKFANIA